MMNFGVVRITPGTTFKNVVCERVNDNSVGNVPARMEKKSAGSRSSKAADQHSVAHINASRTDDLAAVSQPDVVVDAIRFEIGQLPWRASVEREAPKIGHAVAVFNICQRFSVGPPTNALQRARI